MKRSLFALSTLLLLLVGFFLIAETNHFSKKFQRYKIAYASELNFQSSLLDVKDYLNSNEWLTTQQSSTDKWKKAVRAKQKATFYGSLLAGWMTIYFFTFFILFRLNKSSALHFGFVLLNVSSLCLVTGILLPFIELGAFLNNLTLDIGYGLSKTFEGKVYFFYQSKTVIQLIQSLFAYGNWIVGSCILLFSVVFPFAKLALFYSSLFSKKISEQKRLLKIATYMGKYSMADIFVAACFLAFLSFNNLNIGIQTESTTLIGLYFFLGYCLLSIGTYFILQRKKLVNLD